MAARRISGRTAAQVVTYGALLAAGTLALAWLDYRRVARSQSETLYLFIVASAFLAVGVLVGVGALRRPAAPAPFDGNPKAQAALGISAREMTVLAAIADGASNKEIAARLHVSPNTVKTHVARLYDKLGAKRRTDAVGRARELGLLP